MHDADIKPLADGIYADKVRRARSSPMHLKMGWGAEIFGEACERMREGIRAQFPKFAPVEVEALLHQRLGRLRRLYEHGI